MTTEEQADAAPSPQDEALARLAALAEAGSPDDLEAAWMAAVEDEAIPLAGLLAVLETAAARGSAKVTESLAWLLLSVLAERDGPDAALEAAWRAIDFLPSSDVLRDELAGLYRDAHADAPGVETLAEMTLLRKDLTLPAAVRAMERLLALPPGTFISDSRRKSPGRIVGPDPARKVLAVSFGETDRAYDAASLDALEVLDPDDFRPLAVFDQPRLQALAQDDPVTLLRMVLTAYGPRLGMKELKARLLDVAVPAEAWSKWWSAARGRVKREPLIEISDGPQPEFFLRQRPVTYEEEVRERLAAAAAPEDRLLVMLGYLGEVGHDPAAEAEMLAAFAQDLARQADPASGSSRRDVLAALAVLAEVRAHLGPAAPPEPPVPPSLRTEALEVAAEAAAVRDDRLAQRMLVFLRDRAGAPAPEMLAAALPSAAQETADWIAAELAKAGRLDLLAAAVATILRQPDQALSALVWLWKTAVAGRLPPAAGDLNHASVTVRLFLAADDVAHATFEDRSRQVDLLNQVRRAVSAKDFALLKDVLGRTDAAWAKEIRMAVSRNSALTDHLRVQVLSVLAEVHPPPPAAPLPPWEEDVVYTTREALERRQKEYEHLVTVRMPQNATAIGEALGHGDISENAEFTAALEERDRLAEQANRMQTDLVKARPIPSYLAHGDIVNIGTTVRARRLSTGEEEALTFLGPWDAEPARGIYYYRAPLSLAFMGKRVGETAALETGTAQEQWEVLEIRPAV